MNIQTYSNKGLRIRNEDHLLSKQLDSETSLHIIADGMGGYNHGDVASKIVVDSLYSQISQMDLSNTDTQEICEACEKVNQQIKEEGERLSSKIGSTFAAILIRGNHALAFWMGDSRIYHYNAANQLLFQSEDHSLINELRMNRALTVNEIKRYSSIVTRSLTGEKMEYPPQFQVLQYTFTDKIILCSDGLYKQSNPALVLNMQAEELTCYLDSLATTMTDNYSMIVAG